MTAAACSDVRFLGLTSGSGGRGGVGPSFPAPAPPGCRPDPKQLQETHSKRGINKSMLRYFFLRLFPLKWSSCAVSPSASSASSSQWAGLATVPFFAPLCQHHSLQYRQEVSFFPKANETSWTISSFFPRSKDWHKGGSGKRSKSTSQHPPQRKVLTQPARGPGTQLTPKQMAM